MGVLEPGWSRDNTEMGLVGRINVFFLDLPILLEKSKVLQFCFRSFKVL